MFDTYKTRLDRLYNSIMGGIKNIDPNRQTLSGERNPEKMHSLCVAPEYALIDRFTLEVVKQLPPTTAESIRDSDIGSLEDWGERVLGRTLGENEDPEEYRNEILDLWNPDAKGGDNQDLLDWALEVENIRRVYPYVGSRPVDSITADDIEGRLSGSVVYVRSTENNGVPTYTQLQAVYSVYLQKADIAINTTRVVPIINRFYHFEYTLSKNVTGGSASLGEVENKVLDVTYDVFE